MGIDSIKSVDSISTNIEQQEALTKQLEFLKLPGLSEASYNSFIKSIENKKGNDNYNKIIESLLNIDNKEDIIDYIIKNKGFPINTPSNLAFNIFIKDYFDIDIKEEISSKKEEISSEIDNYLSGEVREGLENSNLGLEFEKLLIDFSGEKNEEHFLNIKLFLEGKKGQKLFSQIAKSGNRELFDKTRDFIKASFPDIDVPDFDFYVPGNKLEEKKPDGGGVEKIISGVEKKSDGMLSIDLSHIPATSSLSLLDSDYSFNKKLDSKEVNIALDEYLDSEGLANKGMENVNGFSTSFNQILGKINGMTSNNRYKTSEDYKYGLKSIVESGKINLLGYMSEIKGIPENIKITKQDIQNLGNNPESYISNVSMIQSKIKKIREFISNITVLAYKKYEKSVRLIVEIDEDKQNNQLKTLNFIHSIGLDMIPQSIIEQIFREVKYNNYIKGINLNQETIDLKNGTFGENPIAFGEDNMLGNTGKRNLFKFLEKIIYGEIGGEKSIFNGLNTVRGFTINPTLINAEFESNGIKTNGGWNINHIRNNLKKEKVHN